ncbi:hypothetical protein RUND412_001531 [Rhizina undulata]
MSKRRQDSQLTKDQFESMDSNGGGVFGFNGNRAGNGNNGGPDDTVEPVTMASKSVMAGRKIAPLKKNRFGKNSSGGGAANIPNFFAGATQGAVFGAGAPQNGPSQQQPSQPAASNPFAFGSNNAPAQAPPSNNLFGGSNDNVGGAGSFSFGSNTQPELPKPNLFGSLNTGSNSTPAGDLFGAPTQTTGLFGNPPAQPSGPMFSSIISNGAPTSAGFNFGGSNTNAAPAPPPAQNTSFNKQPFSFGTNQTAGSGSGLFGGNGTESKPASASTSFTFGQTGNAPVAPTPPASTSTSFTFGETSNAAPAPAPAQAQAQAPAASMNFFGGNKPASSAAPAFSFGGMNTASSNTGVGMFGEPKKEEPKKLAPEQPLFKPAPSPEPPASNMFAPKPAPSPEPTSKTSNTLFGAPPAASTATGMFGNFNAPKPAAPMTTGLFGAQPAQEEQKPKPLFSFGPTANAPAEKKEEPAKPLFGAVPTSSAAPSIFGNNGLNAATTNASTGLFGQLKNEELKASAPAPAPAPAPEKKMSPFSSNPITFQPPTNNTTNAFQPSTNNTANTFKPTTNSATNFFQPSTNSSTNSLQPSTDNTSRAFNAFPSANTTNSTNSFSNNNFTSSAYSAPVTAKQPTTTATTTTSSTNSLAPSSTFAATPIAKELSPPIPPEAADWTPAQLTEYHNLFAWRCLNHAFAESLRITDSMSDWSAACQAYTREAAKINNCQQKGEKYRPVLEGGLGGNKRRKDDSEGFKPSSETSKAPSVSSMFGSAAATTSTGWKLAEKPAFGFKPPTGAAPTSEGIKMATVPKFGFKPPTAEPKKAESTASSSKSSPASVFDNPSAATSPNGFVNPFMKTDEISAGENGGDDSSTKGSKATGGDFGRISEPTKQENGVFGNPSNPPTTTGLFGKSSTTSGVFGNGTSTSTTGLFGKLAESKPAPSSFSGTLFGGSSGSVPPPAASTGFQYDSAASKGLGFSFGTTNNGTYLAPPVPSAVSMTSSTEGGNASSATSPGNSDVDHSEEPSDNPPQGKELDRSAKGPGEEEEDSLFEVRAIVYEIKTGATPSKIGVGTLRVLKHPNTGKARVLVRTDGGKVVLNVGLRSELKYEVREKKSVSVVQFLEEGKKKIYSVRVKEEADAKKLGETMEKAKK